MATENLELEYCIFYTLFANSRSAAMKVLLSRDVDGSYFAPLFHRDIFDELVALYKKNKSLSLGLFQKHYLIRPGVKADDSIKFSQFSQQVKASKMAIGDLEHSCEMLVEMYVTRKTLAQMNDLVDSLHTTPIIDLLASMEMTQKRLKALLEPNKIKSVMGLKEGFEERLDRAKRVKENPEENGMICTGLKNLDKNIGRQSAGQFIIYQARTGIGKSMMLMGTAIANFKRGMKVLVITIEMSTFDYLYRFDSNLTGFEHREFTSGDISEDDDKIKFWRSKIQKYGSSGADIMVYWVPSQCTPARVEEIISGSPFKPDLVVVDYAGDMKAGLKGVPDYDARSHAEIYSALKEYAGKYECVLYTAQQSVRGSGGKASTETGAWSDVASGKADIMIAVEVTKEDTDFTTEVNGSLIIGRMTCSIIKGRNIPKCKTHIIPRFQRMSWLEKEEEEMIPCGGGREIKTVKKVMEEKLATANGELSKAIGDSVPPVADDYDLLNAEE